MKRQGTDFLVIFLCVICCYGSEVKQQGLPGYLDLLKDSLEKEMDLFGKRNGIDNHISWMQVGKRDESGENLEDFRKHQAGNGKMSRKEFDDFLKYFEVWQERVKKENEAAQTYILRGIGKRDTSGEKFKEFLKHEVGNRMISWKEFDDFLNEVWKESLKKENEAIQTYRLISIGKRDFQKEKLVNFLEYLETWKHQMKMMKIKTRQQIG